MITGINSEDRLVQATFADYLQNTLGWESVYAFNNETFGLNGLLGRANEREVLALCASDEARTPLRNHGARSSVASGR